ncbi:hypothetical protein JCM14469_17500 [Desulfatiferula olefinivorans]
MMPQDVLSDVNALLDTWTDNEQQTRKAFIELKDHLAMMNDVTYAFKGRAGVSYSLRARHAGQKDRDLFVMLDVIDDDPDARWLSICFYEDLLTDPEERGDLIPQGLGGDDGYCFDLEEWDEDVVTYLKARLDEACKNASK